MTCQGHWETGRYDAEVLYAGQCTQDCAQKQDSTNVTPFMRSDDNLLLPKVLRLGMTSIHKIYCIIIEVKLICISQKVIQNPIGLLIRTLTKLLLVLLSSAAFALV
jgi:hypothetical protein